MMSSVLTYEAPTLEWSGLAPIIIVLGVATLSILIAPFLPHRQRWMFQAVTSLLGLFGALVALALIWDKGRFAAMEFAFGNAQQPLPTFMTGGITLIPQAAVVVLAIVSVLILVERGRGSEALARTALGGSTSVHEEEARTADATLSEAFPLLLMAVGGMMAFMCATDLLTLFVALEVFSLPLYILCGIAARRRLISQEASLKYFLLGAFSSAIFLFGIAWAYTATGAFQYLVISDVSSQVFSAATAQQASAPQFLVIPLLLIIAGLLFKVGAVPFHTWTPDVYEGAPTPITGFMAACTKIAAFWALFNVLTVFSAASGVFGVFISIAAVASMVLGAVVALRQTSVKRMLAYSSIAHAGFILTSLTAISENSPSSLAFYLVTYGITTVGTFAVIVLVRERGADGSYLGEATELSQWQGLGRRAPILATSFSILLLATAGIPLTSGFIGKFLVFKTAVEHDATPLVVVGVLASAVAAFFYARLIMTMWAGNEDEAQSGSIASGRPLTTVVVALCTIATLAFGLYPTSVTNLIDESSDSVSASADQ